MEVLWMMDQKSSQKNENLTEALFLSRLNETFKLYNRKIPWNFTFERSLQKNSMRSKNYI